ncbi:MAG: TetR/AcrR family transcriptional regulator [Gemmatimonadaceae bacterium]
MSKGSATRGRIVETALRVASVEGLEGISLGRLATDVGMSKSGLFAHFDCKEALQLDVLAAAVEKFRELVIAPALTAPRGEPRLRALFDRWLAWGRHETLPGGCVFTHAIAELDDRPGPARDALAASQKEWLAFLAGAVRIAIDQGHLRREVEPELVAFQIYGTILSYYHAARLFRDPAAESHARRSFDSILDAARPPHPR